MGNHYLKGEFEMNVLRNFANLIKVKTIVTLIVIIVFAVLALRGDVSADNVMIIVTSVIAFYFGTQHEKKVAANDVQEVVETTITEE